MDGEQRAVRALDLLRQRPALWGATPVLLYGFDDLTTLQLDTIETLGRVIDAPVTVSLAYEPGRVAFAGRAASFHALVPLGERAPPAAGALRALRATGARGARPSRALAVRAGRRGGRAMDPGDALTLLEGGGERAELELVASEIGSLLERGTAPEEIAVLVRSGGTDTDLLEEVFTAAGIPFALRGEAPSRTRRSAGR